jgi:hypothetical protein
MNVRKFYSFPAIVAEDQMEQTALQTCWVTEAYDGNNFAIAAECAIPVAKGGAFDAISGCATLWVGGDNKTAEPFS